MNSIWIDMNRCAHLCTSMHMFHIIFALIGYFTISLHLEDSNPIKSNQHHLKRKSRPYSWCFYFFAKMKHHVFTFKWNMAFIWKWKNVNFHHILTHWKLWYFSWDLSWLKFRTRTFKKCKWFVFKFINYYFIIVNCQVAMRKGHKNADMERYAPIWRDMVWCGEFSLQCGEFSLQYGESYERSPHWN